MNHKFLSLLILFLLVCTLLLILSNNWRLKDKFLEWRYDWVHINEEVQSTDEIDVVFEDLQQFDYEELEKEYVSFTNSDVPKYAEMLKGRRYFQVRIDQINKKIVYHHRLKEFIAKDKYYKQMIWKGEGSVYCIFNRKMFYKLLELKKALQEGGYNEDGFIIKNGHRHPRYNEEVGGAGLSRHLLGEAVDLQIKDINNDGISNTTDKEIVLKLLDEKIIGNKGGIGRYPGTQSVHFDVRGKRARWDSY